MNKFVPPMMSSLALCGVMALPAGAAEEPVTPGLSRQRLLTRALPPLPAGGEARVIRVKFPSGYKTALHTHEGPGPRYVLRGRLRVEDSGQARVYGPGDVFWETGAAMTIQSIGGDDAEMVIFEVIPGQGGSGS